MKKSLSFLKLGLSSQLLLVVTCVFLFGHLLPETIQSCLYALSLSLKSLLLFFLPLIIFSCLFSCLLTFQGKKAIGFMLVLFVMVCFSTYLSTLVAYGIGSLNLIHLGEIHTTSAQQANALLPLWDFGLPEWISNEKALYAGLILGTYFSFFPHKIAQKFSDYSKRKVHIFLEKCFIPTLPFFVLGFVIKMQHDGALADIMQSYFQLLVLITVTLTLYLLLLFYIAAGFNAKKWIEYLKNVSPVTLMAFSTMSSLAALPMTLKAAEQNTQDKILSQAIIPGTVNIHMIGVGISIPLMAFAILTSFGLDFPSFASYGHFVLYFVLAQFAVAAVPAGGILVMIPILESYLGFTSEMSALITALFILFDPIVTTSNVLGNSVFVIFFSKIFRSFSKPTVPATEETL